MNRDDIQKLLGGYATGTLNDAERQALFQAALEDQNLFDALAGESALKDLLDDPASRAYLLEALPAKPKAVVKPWPAWSWAAVGSIAAVVVVGVFLLRGPAPEKPAPQLVAMARQPEREAAARGGLETIMPVEKQKALSRKETMESSSALSALNDARASSPTVRLQSQAVMPEVSQSANGLRAKDEKADGDAENRELAKSPIAVTSAAAPAPPPPAAKPAGQLAEADAVKTKPPLAISGALDRPAEGKAASADSTSAAAPQQKSASQEQAAGVVGTGGAAPMAAVSNAAGAQPSARQLFYGATPGGELGFSAGRTDVGRAAKRAAAMRDVSGVRYAVLRRRPNGSFVEVDPTTVFQAGDALRLSVETNSAGFLAIWDGDIALANLRVIARTQYTIPPDGAIRLSAPAGEKHLLVVFSRQPENKPASLATGLLVEQSPENAVYVAGGGLAAPVSFSITLTYR